MLDNVMCLVVSDTTIRTFNSNNRWEELGDIEILEPSLFLSKGFKYDILTTPFNKQYYAYTPIEKDGEIILESEELDSSWGITAIDSVDRNGSEMIEIEIPQFLPKDGIKSNEKIFYYSQDSSFNPYIFSVDFSPSSTHNKSITYTVKYAFNYNERIKFRCKINDGEYGDWSTMRKSTEDIVGNIFNNQLSFGTNRITIQIANEAETKVTTHEIADAITIVNNKPGIMFVNENSDACQLNFIISDDDTDKIKYKIEIINTTYPEGLILSDWTDGLSVPYDKIMRIDTSKIVPNDQNTIRITVQDKYEETHADYIFTGEYRNLVFLNEDKEYMSTDKGVILKILDFGYMVAGAQSEVKKVTLKNNNPYPIKNLRLKVVYNINPEGIYGQISKSSNPFIPLEEINFGSEKIDAYQSKDFYVRIDSKISAQGILDFDIDANADLLDQL